MDQLGELRNVWHWFAAGQVGPEAVVGAARRACDAGVQYRAPSLVYLANLQPPQYGFVSEIFARVRAELQATAPVYAPVVQSSPQPHAAVSLPLPSESLKPWQRGGLSGGQRTDLKRAGWVCVLAGVFWMWALGLVAVVIGVLLNQNDDEQGGPMVLLGAFVCLLGLALGVEPLG